MARGARRDVELVEDDEHGTGGTPPAEPTGYSGTTGTTGAASPARRRVLVAGAALLVVLVAVGLVGQSVVTSRERARVAAVRGLPGVVDPVDGPVSALRTAPDEGLRRATARTPDGLLVSSHGEEDGRETVRAVDPATGTVAWDTELLKAGAPLAVPPGGEVVRSRGTCEPYGATGDLLVCLADDAVSLVGRGTLTQRPPTTTRLVVLDARDGSVVRDLSAAAAEPLVSRQLVVLDDLVVLAGSDVQDAHVRAVTGDGTVAWDATFPVTTTTAFGSHVDLRTTLDEVAVVTPDALRLLDATGRTVREVELRSADGVLGTAGATVVVETAGGETVAVRAGGEHRVRGRWVALTVDDASAPGLLLTSDVDGLHAWDADGASLWTSDAHVTSLDALLLDGRVLAGTGTDVTALDAATGEVRWRAGGLLPGAGLATDGRQVLALAPRPGGSRPRDLVALDVADGRATWRVTLPTDVDGLRPLFGVLTAYSFDLVDPRPESRPVFVVLGRP